MGAPSLKIKRELNYRRGSAHKSCGDCNHIMRNWPIQHDTRHGLTATNEPRCEIIGLRQGRLYRINLNNICDKFDNSRLMARLTGKEVRK